MRGVPQSAPDLDIEDAKIGKSRTAICRNRRGVVVECVEAERPCTARARLPNGSAQQGPADAPALYLYYAAAGERVFDIAKRYHARAKDLAAANRLPCDGGVPQDCIAEAACLLIPAAQ